MSFFGNSKAPQQVPSIDSMDPARREILVQAKMEVDGLSAYFNKLTSICFDKCVAGRHTAENLAISELTCVDRCVVKYMETQTIVGKMLQSWQMEAAANRGQMLQQMGQPPK